MKDPESNSRETPVASPTDSLPLDALFEALSDRRRRYVLRHLDDAEPPITRAELAAEIAASEYEAPEDDDVAEVAVSLYHAHLPKLAELDLVKYDLDADLVRPSDRRDEVDRFLRIGESKT